MKQIILMIVMLVSFQAFAGANEKTFTVKGMTCVSCAASVERELKKLPSVSSMDISLSKGSWKISLKTSHSNII